MAERPAQLGQSAAGLRPRARGIIDYIKQAVPV